MKLFSDNIEEYTELKESFRSQWINLKRHIGLVGLIRRTEQVSYHKTTSPGINEVKSVGALIGADVVEIERKTIIIEKFVGEEMKKQEI